MRKYYKLMLVILFLTFFSAALIYCGGGGGEDDEECTSTFISGTYNYVFGYNTSLTIDGGFGTITIGFFSFTGTYNTNTGDLTIDDTSSISANAPSPFGSFTANVTQTLQIPADSDPISGELEVRSGQDTITVTIVTTPSPGVNVSVNGGEEQFYTWGDFDPDSLTGADAVAAFAAGGIRLLFMQFELVAEASLIIDQNQNVFPGSPTITIPCDSFTSSSDITANPGSIDFSWTDDGSGEIDFFDSFALGIDQCWADDTSSVEDELLDGTVNLSEILFGFDDSCRLVTFGFNIVELQNLSVSETTSDVPAGGNVSVSAGSTASITGSFFFYFQ